MTPLDFAQNLAKSDDPDDHILAAAMVARGLSDDDPATLRKGWPVETSAEAAIEYLGLDHDAPGLVQAVIERMPSISDAMLNRR